jgi:hypothetical protein
MQLEYAFAQAGGLLLAGPDPTGNGGVVPGFGDQPEIELLVEAGFTPLEAIKVGTWNGAVYLRKQDQIGSAAVGKNADLVVVKGDPSKTDRDHGACAARTELTGICFWNRDFNWVLSPRSSLVRSRVLWGSLTFLSM